MTTTRTLANIGTETGSWDPQVERRFGAFSPLTCVVPAEMAVIFEGGARPRLGMHCALVHVPVTQALYCDRLWARNLRTTDRTRGR